MTTTDAEAIARHLREATSLVIEQMHEAGIPICMCEGETTWRTYHAGFDLSLFAQRITDACCDAILSYLASRREALEPVAPSDCVDRMNCGLRRIATEPDIGLTACSRPNCPHTTQALSAPPSPGPAGEVERLREALQGALAEHDHKRKMQVMLTEPEWVEKARAARKGMGNE